MHALLLCCLGLVFIFTTTIRKATFLWLFARKLSFLPLLISTEKPQSHLSLSFLLDIFFSYGPWYFFFFLGADSLAGPLLVHKGRVVTISDLKEVLKAKTEEKTKGGEETSQSQGELLLLETSCQTSVSLQHQHTLTHTHTMKRKLRQTPPETWYHLRISSRSAPGGISYFSGCWVSEIERETEGLRRPRDLLKP